MTDDPRLVFFEIRSDLSIFDALPLVCILAFERRIIPVTVSIRLQPSQSLCVSSPRRFAGCYPVIDSICLLADTKYSESDEASQIRP